MLQLLQSRRLQQRIKVNEMNSHATITCLLKKCSFSASPTYSDSRGNSASVYRGDASYHYQTDLTSRGGPRAQNSRDQDTTGVGAFQPNQNTENPTGKTPRRPVGCICLITSSHGHARRKRPPSRSPSRCHPQRACSEASGGNDSSDFPLCPFNQTQV